MFPHCKNIQKDCFARNKDNGECRALTDTHFPDDCPFYKTVKEYNEGLKKYGDLKQWS